MSKKGGGLMKKINIKDGIKSRGFKMGIIFVLIFVAIYCVLISAVVPKKYSLKEGDIAKIDIKAPRDVEDVITINRKRDEAAALIKDVNANKSEEVKIETKQVIENLFSKIIEINRETINETSNLDNTNDKNKGISTNNEKLTEEQKRQIEEENKKKEADRKKRQEEFKQKELETKLLKIKEESPIDLSDEDFETILKLSPKESNDLKSFLIEKMSLLYEETSIYEKKIENDEGVKEIDRIKTEDLSNAQRFVETQFNKSKFSKDIKELGKSMGYSLIRPNFVYDAEATAKLKEEAKNNVEPVVIKQDQIIIKEGEPVTKAQIEVLRDLGLLDEDKTLLLYIYISLAVFIIIVIVLQWLYLYKYHREIFENPKKIILINIINFITLIFARTLNGISPYIIPLALAPMLITLLINNNASITISIINCMFISAAVQFNLPITVIAVLNSVIGAMFLKNMEQRNDILYSSIFIAIINSLFALSLGVMQINNNLIDVVTKSGLAFLGSILAGILTIGFLPIFESIFDIVTTVKLLELSNPNHPLLKRLLIEAPGTYHHSVLVANLAELGAQAVGANSVLARVSSYYHDVGKLKRPYFFKENQMGRENPHNKITPNLSTLIIISHVKDGIELAKEYKIPIMIRDIIRQHHGTSLVKYFYITMKNNSDNPDEVKEEDFRYKGPTPLSKEAGIVMLADSVEAAVRSISEPTKGKIEEMVNNIIKGRLNEGQLDNCDLTLKDLEKIRKAFLKGLSGIYHERIEYPKLENKDQNK